ncbi:hypothetical protein BGZ83_010004 [Gryganskiella cystojenkinii]|nr:hypothetical protein BGZ83_010004 [Gryganskiella cystojenkinii]
MTICRRLDSFVVDKCDILNKRVEDRQEEEYGYSNDEDEDEEEEQQEEEQEANEHEQSSSREPRSAISALKTLYLRKNANLGLATALRWFREVTLAQFLKNCSHLTEITIRGERMNYKTFDVLKPRFGQLWELNLFESTDMKNWLWCDPIRMPQPNRVCSFPGNGPNHNNNFQNNNNSSICNRLNHNNNMNNKNRNNNFNSAPSSFGSNKPTANNSQGGWSLQFPG